MSRHGREGFCCLFSNSTMLFFVFFFTWRIWLWASSVFVSDSLSGSIRHTQGQNASAGKRAAYCSLPGAATRSPPWLWGSRARSRWTGSWARMRASASWSSTWRAAPPGNPPGWSRTSETTPSLYPASRNRRNGSLEMNKTYTNRNSKDWLTGLFHSTKVWGPVHTGRVCRFACKSFDVACNAVWTLPLATMCSIFLQVAFASTSASCVNEAWDMGLFCFVCCVIWGGAADMNVWNFVSHFTRNCDKKNLINQNDKNFPTRRRPGTYLDLSFLAEHVEHGFAEGLRRQISQVALRAARVLPHLVLQTARRDATLVTQTTPLPDCCKNTKRSSRTIRTSENHQNPTSQTATGSLWSLQFVSIANCAVCYTWNFGQLVTTNQEPMKLSCERFLVCSAKIIKIYTCTEHGNWQQRHQRRLYESMSVNPFWHVPTWMWCWTAEAENTRLALMWTPLYLHFILPPLLLSVVTARVIGLALRRIESGVTGIITPSPAAADMTSESRLVSESLIDVSAAAHEAPIGVVATSDAKYFSCSTLEDVTGSDPAAVAAGAAGAARDNTYSQRNLDLVHLQTLNWRALFTHLFFFFFGKLQGDDCTFLRHECPTIQTASTVCRDTLLGWNCWRECSQLHQVITTHFFLC